MVKKNKVSVADKKKKLYNRVMDEKRITTDQTTIRINKYLSAAGVCSRREADQLTDAGRVTVAGKEIGTGERIPADAEVFLDGRPVKAETRQVLLLFYKPRGIVCSTKKQRQETTVTEFLDYPVRVYPVGRLDKDTTGLLLLTNDGALAHDLLSPKKHVDKTYRVRPEKPLSAEDIHRLESGLEIGDDKPTAPAKAVITEDGDLLLTIHEGRFHQVKRMLQAIGNQVLTLERIRFGSLSLDPALSRGDYRALTEDEIKHLRIKE